MKLGSYSHYTRAELSAALKWKQESWKQGKLRFIHHGFCGWCVWNQSYWGKTESSVFMQVSELMDEWEAHQKSAVAQ